MLARDNRVCQVVPGCPTEANTCDHVVPVWAGMPDSMFFDPSNLRASCQTHNVARGFAKRLESDVSETAPSSVVTRDYT